MSDFGRRHHDMGGQDAGLVEAHEHDHAFWEKKIDAVRRLLADGKRQMFTVDEMRRGIEELGAKAYDEMSYYERWAASTTNVLLEKGIITIDELGRRMEEVEARLRSEAEDQK